MTLLNRKGVSVTNGHANKIDENGDPGEHVGRLTGKNKKPVFFNN